MSVEEILKMMGKELGEGRTSTIERENSTLKTRSRRSG
jgi:hypothetical protein